MRHFNLSPKRRYPSSSLPVKKRCREHLDNHNNGASTFSSTTNLCCFQSYGTEKRKDPPNQTIGKIRLYLKPRKQTDGFDKVKVDPLPVRGRKTMRKYPPISNDDKAKVESSSPSCTSNKRLNVEQIKRKSGSKKPKIALNPSMERKVPGWVSSTQNPQLFFETTLSMSDVSATQSHLLIPFNTLINKDFLTSDEERAMNKEEYNNYGVGTILVNEKSQKWNLRFRKRSMKKTNCGKQTFNYVLNSRWNDVVKGNNLKANDKIRLWSSRFRGVLCFALEVLGSN